MGYRIAGFSMFSVIALVLTLDLFFNFIPKRARQAGLALLCLLAMPLSMYISFVWAPLEAVQREVQKIFYFHVSIAWIGFFSFFLVFIASILYLWKRELRWETMAHAAAEVGVVFMILVCITGSIWAKGTWGIWWKFDDIRLALSLLVMSLYIAYLILRRSVEEETKRTRYAAVFGILSFFSVPLNFMAIRWWKSLAHPDALVETRGGLADEMLFALMVSLTAFTFFYFLLLRDRIALFDLEDKVRQLKDNLGS